MKDALLSVYRAVAAGRLTRAEALGRIKALESQRREGADVVLATREWRAETAGDPGVVSNRRGLDRVLLWGVAPQAAHVLEGHAAAWEALDARPGDVSRPAALDELFSWAAGRSFEAIRSALADASRRAGSLHMLLIVAEEPDSIVAAGLEAMLRTAMEENPALLAGTVRVPADIDGAELSRVVAEVSKVGEASGVAVRYVRRQGVLEREVACWLVIESGRRGEEEGVAPVPYKEGGCYLITGGAGGLGLRFAREITRQTRHARIVLAGRSALSPDAAGAVEALRRGGHRIEHVRLDVTHADEVEALVARLRSEGQRLDGVLHCAGVTRDSFAIRKTAEELTSVLAPKVAGLVNLDRATRDEALDFMVLCSSVAACWGIVGQVDYAAANAFMDAFAARRNRLVRRGERTGRTLSVNWPLWRDGGMVLEAETRARLEAQTGMRPLATVTAMRALRRGLALAHDQLLVMEGDGRAMRALLERAQPTPRVVSTREAADVGTARVDGDFKARALEYVVRQFSEVVKIPVAKLRPEAPLEHYGIDSILAMKLVTHLESIFGKLPKTLAFEYQTLAQLNEYFCASHGPRLAEILEPRTARGRGAEGPREPAGAVRSSPVPQKGFARVRAERADAAPATSRAGALAERVVVRLDEAIAVVGLSGRYPDAWDLDEYWRNLSQGRDCIREVPPERWRWQEFYRDVRGGQPLGDGQHSSRWGGFIEGADEFDPRFFNITPREAEQIDPQERLFLQHAWMAIEDAGYTRAALEGPRGGQVGVYAGVMYGEYNRSGSLASIANRVSYVLNVHGPSLTLDTMCSSSLTAIHLACQDLRSGRTDMAIAGGVNLSIHPGKYSMLSAGQFISSDGHCQSFGEGGDGYIPGEGVGVVVLKRLSEAERDGDAIHAVIRGSALNHGGKTNGYTVPNPQAQAAVIAEALRDAGVDARHVSYVEAHGTGTKLGDPIEIAALSKAFREQTAGVGFCRIGSAKSNIGHCESAAGVAGLTKVILQMRHGQIVPSLHSERLNPNIDFESTPFVVNQTLRTWDPPVVDGRRLPLIAGVSSFGAGGSNAHILVEAYARREIDETPAVPGDGRPSIVLLSARTLPELRRRAEALKAFVDGPADVDLRSLAYTLQVGREAMDERLGLCVGSRAELIGKLDVFLASAEIEDGALADDLYYARARRHRDVIALFAVDKDLQASVEGWFDTGKVSRLLDVWTKGLDVDWRKLYGASRPARMHLPVYPFARERYWREEPVVARAVEPSSRPLHSLLHQNASKPGRQCYRSELRVDDPRIAGLRRNGLVGLPIGLQIEAARAALADALPLPQGGAWELQDVRFAAPGAAADSLHVNVVVMPPGQGVRPSLSKAAFELSIGPDPGRLAGQGLAEPRGDAEVPKVDLAAMLRQATVLFADRRAIAEAWRSMGIETTALYQPVETLHRTADGLLLRLAPSEQAGASFADCVVDPSIVEGAMLCAQWLHPVRDGVRWPAGVAALRTHPGEGPPRYAWLRASGETAPEVLSVDLVVCGEDGTVLLQLERLQLMPGRPAGVSASAEPQAVVARHDEDRLPVIASLPRSADIVFRAAAPASSREGAPAPEGPTTGSRIVKPQAVALTSTDAASVGLRTAVASKPAISLVPLDGAVAASIASVVFHDRGDGIFALRLQPVEGRLDAGLADAAAQALAHAREQPGVKLLLVESGDAVFLEGGGAGLDEAGMASLLRGLASFPAPTAAVLSGRAVGLGFRLACTCDFVVAVDGQEYGFAAPEGPEIGPGLGARVDRDGRLSWLAARFGAPLATSLASSDRLFTGRELQEAGWGATVVSREHLAGAVASLCRSLSDKPPDALRLLKAHLARELDGALAGTEVPREEPLARAGDTPDAAAHAAVDLQRTGGRFVLRVKAGGATSDDELMRQLGRALRACRDAELVLLYSELDNYLPDGAAGHPGVLRDVLSELSRLRMPVIAVVEQNAANAGLLLVLACDLAVYGEEGRYGGLSLRDHRTHLGLVEALVTRRFGDWGAEWVLSGESQEGRALRQRFPLLHVCAAAQVSSLAQRLADRPLVSSPGLFGDKSWLAAALARHAGSGRDGADDVGDAPADPGELRLASTVVRASVDADGIVVVRLEDRHERNMFSAALISGLQEVFDRIPHVPGSKAVVLVGHDTYFSSGGTQEGLKAIQEGKVRFTDFDVFHLPMRCPLPVIAAMQGHALGAGWTLGLFCDSVLFSEESRYVSPYMSLGFTPGAGATGVLPARLGFDLARESLFTGGEMSGAELARRNPSLTVLPRERVLASALALARRASRQDRRDLVAWKTAAVAHRLDAWRALFAREVEMHEATLVGQAEARARIEGRFGRSSMPEADRREVLPPAASSFPMPASVPTSSRADILPTIRRLLAEELRVAEAEIDPSTPFVELGLDSISGVTWIRKVNGRFGLSIEATKIYSYSSLEKLTGYIGELMALAAPAGAAPAPPVRPHVEVAGVRRTLIGLLAQELRQSPESIDADAGFVELGLDSISGVTWIRAINATYGISIEATRIYTYPTVEKLARFVCERLAQTPASHSGEVSEAQGRRGGTGAAVPDVGPVATLSFEWPELSSWLMDVSPATPVGNAARSGVHGAAIAVVGMAGRFPMAPTVDAFWDNIAGARNCISEIPASRWDTRPYYVEGQPGLGQSNSKWMGVLEGHDRFDPLFFGLSPIEAEAMDPQQRLFLQCCWHGMEDAGYTSERLSGSKCGVFVGCAYGDYNLLSREQQIGALGFTGGATSILAARVSYFLNLQGPCVSIDTACSSSLVAIASACDSLVTGASDVAFAGGVYVMANADMFLKTAHAGMLSPDGRCYTFDQRANGFVPGEGVGVVVLKRLEDAERDGDRILGVLRGWGVNQDGRTNGITAPNAESQRRLITDVYERFALDPGDVQLIEAHGTGTKLGDPIEVDGLKSAFRPSTDRKGFCAIGSVKTNIGHCLTAAGIAGLIKLLLALRHRQLPPSINFETPNEHLGLDDSPFFVNTTLREWAVPPGRRRHAAISSFGFSGTNAHLVLAEYAPRASAPSTPISAAGTLFPLSARTPERLRQKAIELRAFVSADPDVDLASLAWSLQVHRDAMEERLCFVARRTQEVVDGLTAYIDGAPAAAVSGLFAGNVRQGREAVRLLNEDAGMAGLVADKYIAEGNLSRLSELWVKGLALEWRKLYGRQPAMISLPKYPFADEAYWIAPSGVAYPEPSARGDERPHRHPLLQEKVADLVDLGYCASHGEENDADGIADRTNVMHLPAYAFVRLRCWIPSKEEVGLSPALKAAARAPSAPEGVFLQNRDVIAELLADVEADRLSAADVAARIKQLA